MDISILTDVGQGRRNQDIQINIKNKAGNLYFLMTDTVPMC